MAISLGVLNATNMMATSTFVLFAQEVLELNATRFGLITTGFALGGVIGSFVADRVSKVLGQGGSLFTTILLGVATMVVSGLTSSFWVFWAMGVLMSMSAVLWNVITVSLRQSLIPDRILGRVNSVYRFLGWGMMPIGSVIGGVIVALLEPAFGREVALRAPFIVAAVITGGLFIYALPRLNSTRIEEAKAAAEEATV
jgi:MFS family permease